MSEYENGGNGGAELVPVEREPAPPPVVAGELGPNTVSQAGERLNVLKGLKRLAIGYTTADEWTDFGGHPYLQATGAMKFAEIFGVSFTDSRIEAHSYADERGPVTEFYGSCIAHFRGRQCPGEGVASTSDEFFNGREEDPANPGKKRARRLPMSEIDRPSVRKKAITQAMAAATKKILGLSFTWDEVKAALGEKASAGVTSVKFGGKSEFRGEEKKAGKGEMTETKKELLSIIMEIAMGDQEQAKETLWGLTKFEKDGKEFGSRSILEMSEKWAAGTLPKAKKMLAKIREQEAAQGSQEGGAA